METTNPKTTLSATQSTDLPVIVEQTRDMDSLRAEFLADLDVGDSTHKLYGRVSRQFFSWLAESGRAFFKLERTDILAYKAHLKAKASSMRTIALYLGVVRIFFEWASKRKWILHNTITRHR